jgi:hypothetical protein
VPARVDELAEGFARHVDVAEQLAAAAPPTVEAAVEEPGVCVAEFVEFRHGERRELFAVVVDDDGRGAPRDAIADFDVETIERQGRSEQGMRLREGCLIAHVEQRYFFPLEEDGADFRP